MARWSYLMGAPRRGQAPGQRPRGTSAHEATTSARRAAALGGLALAGAGALAWTAWPTPLAAWLLLADAILLVPLLVGLRVRALGLALRATGRRPHLRLHIEALARPDAADLTQPPAWRRAGVGLLRRWTEGALLPAALGVDLVVTLPFALARGRDRLRYDASADTLATALSTHGAHVDVHGRGLVVQLTDESAPLRLRVRTLLFPLGARVVDARGAPEELARLRRILEGPLGHAGAAAWSDAGARLERRIDGLARDATHASTLEERGRVLEELDRFERILHERDLPEEDATLLTHKTSALRARLATRMLSEPPGARLDGRVLAQAPALLPPLKTLLVHGGLDALRRVVFVPHWVAPVRTRFGETEVVVNAATGRADLAESHALLDAMRRRGPALLLEVGPDAQFLPAPPPTSALARELRGVLPPGTSFREDLGPACDVVYVPYLPTPEGHVSAITGRPAPDLGAGAPVARTLG